MIRIRTKINGWTVITILMNGYYNSIAYKTGHTSFSLSGKDLFAAGQNHLQLVKQVK